MRSERKKKKIIVVVGPTASGKSALAVTLARKFCGEVISADSRQVYKGLNVGTGKITKKEMRRVPHHLLDVAYPKKQFTAADYEKLARAKISEIFARGRLPIICGGTGHYIDAALGRVQIPDVPPNPALRKKLEKKSAPELFALLKTLNKHRAETIDSHNPRRLVRAIEIALADADKSVLSASGGPPHSIRIEWPRPHPSFSERLAFVRSLNVVWLGITLPPAELKKKISMRLFARIRRYKMIEEARRLHKRGLSWKRMESLGLEYRYLSRYLRGYMTKVEMIEKLQTEIYLYAKRQMTWFKRNKEIQWFLPSQKKQIFDMLEHEGL
ncbi:MAG: tRNA (adenosine(37)-N6)-dimethylallyltransferase MiaA [Candidatus Taylorbacteria bacterium RIFCSPHIGHO2_02_FULL_47_18]|uniref:tRNA dimethylallyltransferase n=1 Tax=Candidatus Taylorbacteria bacterium RIFCSPLOWO2_01_FULL_48_100 TaxID=1802322 RepID=A0A1G2NEA4_9BACT|nr:MAG: tRNA (adenosine(37)-N6)-dimethylallyltransferase MiaA [Candidatus Taylorbacteria bacterium RIFCSPHIGHO2_01_FULL_48_38]OHA28399.1 MAG: tRNA (adenosine(37)-N6)-dimethylallyltransferase MiaA [Candidatus Taylorbacteria bacterium RIFCSPHIGHO2_02_FULL_47_18]OHA34418.1 MAG: tRNA (adenosine(37)-N6)-dimethylallyltransferase MiaA [Candidatus Taylorbacteria bacterium RIFCSPLOWO2_01_FULL_48_100]OHA45511.1 MAG: tRNA (adenosine(37)-N6)-dimethylallyltransferase MiaA [Candidatus Taylorbacteria bacterium